MQRVNVFGSAVCPVERFDRERTTTDVLRPGARRRAAAVGVSAPVREPASTLVDASDCTGGVIGHRKFL